MIMDFIRSSPFASFRWADFLDIVVMAFIFYRAFLVLRGTRAFQSMVGLLGLALIYIMSQRLQLHALHWLLESFFVYLVLAVLILFQNDIRRGLARAGGRFFRGFATVPEASAHEDVVKSAFALASRRIGALVVIERGASLDDYAESGHRIDARVSQELLLALFHPTSPLHDGAVTLQSGMATAAKVFLPLSLSKDIARYFGTRHRAALGLSEETDAVVIVVSEERGTVSLVVGGALTPVQDTNELRQRLQEIFQPVEAQRPVAATGSVS